MNMLVTKSASLNSMAGTPERGELKMVVDSGATQTVIGEGVLKAVELAESPDPESGVVYTVANGGTFRT